MKSGFQAVNRLLDARRSPHGERGLKFREEADVNRFRGRSPHGERGLKSLKHLRAASCSPVAPHTGSVD